MSTLSSSSVSKYVVSDDTRQSSDMSTQRSSDLSISTDEATESDIVDAAAYIYVNPRRFQFSVAHEGMKEKNTTKAIVPDSSSERKRAQICAQTLNKEFIRDRRTSARPAIVITLVILSIMCLYHMVYYHIALRETDGSRPADGMYGYDMAGRIVAILCGISLAALAATESWASNKLLAQLSFLFFVLILSLAWAFGQLIQHEPDYGSLVCVQAFIFTFLPLHPFEQISIAVLTWLVYGMPSWSQSLPSMNTTYPLIIVGVGVLEAFAHSRRYLSMLQGFLDKKRVDTQRVVMANESLKCDGLLRSMLPRSIIVKLELGEAITPERFDSVTVIFAEICHFGKISQKASAHELVNLLNDIFSTFDGLIDRWQVYKVETVCQVYMAVAGCPTRSKTHAEDAANLALDFIHCAEYLAGTLDIVHTVNEGENNPRNIPADVLALLPSRRKRVRNFFDLILNASGSDSQSKMDLHSETLQIHVGLNSGRIRAGVVGINNPRFKLFGDTVNTASRMESTCEAGRIQVSPSTTELLRSSEKYVFELEERGKIDVKGKGQMLTHYVNSGKVRVDAMTIASLSGESSPREDKSPKVKRSTSMQSTQSTGAHLRHLQNTLIQSAHKLHGDSTKVKTAHDIEANDYADSTGERGLPGIVRYTMNGQNNSSVSNVDAIHSCSWFCLWWRIKALAVIDTDVDMDTLIVLDRDVETYRNIMMPLRVKQLQLMVLSFLFILSCGLSLSDYWVFIATDGEIDPERQLMGMLRNSVAVPVLLMLLVACRAESWFTSYGEYLTLAAIFVSGGFIIYSVFMVYLGDPVS